MKSYIKNFFLILTILGSFGLSAQIIEVPELTGRVVDLTGTLTSDETTILENKLRAFEESKGSQIVVLIISTTGDEVIEQFSIRVAEEWKIGREGVDDGIIFLVAKDDRKLRIEVGYGLEGAVPDALAKRIISNVVIPEFRSGHFYDGINDGLDVIISAVQGEELPAVVAEKKRDVAVNSNSGGVFGFLIFGFIWATILKALLGKKLGTSKTSTISFITTLIVGFFFIGFFPSLIITTIITAFTSIPSGRGGGGGYYGGYYGGGRSSSGWSSGGGFGGFSGGGGGFGGGGASGSW